MPMQGINPSSSGWGILPSTYESIAFRFAALLVPVWVPPLVAMLAGVQPSGAPVGLALLLAPFIFIPGVYTISNIPRWSGPIRFVASLAYVAVASVVGFVALSRFIEILR